jgi:hypothetical protein
VGFDPHRQARFLLDEARMEGISHEDAGWLQSHTADCAACARYEEELEGIVRGLKSFGFDVNPASIGRTQSAVAAHARKLSTARWWLAAAAVFLAAAAVPVYQGVRKGRQEKSDALLMEQIENRVGRAVPVAMEPLVLSRPEESK